MTIWLIIAAIVCIPIVLIIVFVIFVAITIHHIAELDHGYYMEDVVKK